MLSTPAGVAGPAGKIRPRSPRPAAPSSASQTACSATSPSEWPWSRGAPSIRTPPRTSGVPGPNGWLSWPIPVRGRPPAPWSAAAARARSAGSVTLMLPGSPSMTWTGMLQASSSAASSVNTSGPSAGKRSNAARRTDRRTPWGVCAVASADRSTVASTRPAAIRLTVSPMGTTGIAAPWTAAAVATPSISSGETTGRAPSCTRTTRAPSSAARPPSRRSSSARPAATDPWRRSAPATTATTLEGSHGASRIASTRSDDVTTTSRATSGRHGERVERPREQRAAGDRRRQLVDAAHPGRGAGRNDDRVRGPRGGVQAHVSPAGAGRRSSARRRSAGRA